MLMAVGVFDHMYLRKFESLRNGTPIDRHVAKRAAKKVGRAHRKSVEAGIM
jgi:hypothetical protein